MNGAERRAHPRYRDPYSTTLRLLIKDGVVEKPVTGLLVNESYTGLSCVYVGQALEAKSKIIWQETEDISTPCKVIRCQKLDTDIFLLALRIVD